ncbi:hypothetical protein Zmor_011194 [Zophobas morio]|uniref:Chitin-binding type-2 domain-containing protein n=1 Tax=Zophobas morio TaxID=2755281 RepID=A0AA38IR54_9CUCU|nr:hypothetical protein Zmor_011194 [Zophobas morio]
MIFPILLVVLVATTLNVQAGPSCPQKDGKYPVYIPHEDCTKFWECSNGTPHLFDCPANLHFNPKLNVCDWPDQAGCNDSDDSSGSSSSSSSSSESNEDD